VSQSQSELPVTSEKKTVELCADELRKGIRCNLSRGHVGDHECHTAQADAITWNQPTK
jgi:hypothetical protein